MATKRYGAGAVAMDGCIYVVGGKDSRVLIYASLRVLFCRLESSREGTSANANATP